MGGRLFWILAIIIVLFVLFYPKEEKFNGLNSDINKSSENSGVQIGGHFTLTDQNGKVFDSHQAKTPLKIVFFGFTYCPEICPTDLNNISEALNELGNKAKFITPIFISVDPKRDTHTQLKSYIEAFHPSFVALTGEFKKIHQVKNQYKVYSAEREDPDSSEYTVDHSSFIYILDDNYGYLSHMGHDSSSKQIVKKLESYIK